MASAAAPVPPRRATLTSVGTSCAPPRSTLASCATDPVVKRCEPPQETDDTNGDSLTPRTRGPHTDGVHTSPEAGRWMSADSEPSAPALSEVVVASPEQPHDGAFTRSSSTPGVRAGAREAPRRAALRERPMSAERRDTHTARRPTAFCASASPRVRRRAARAFPRAIVAFPHTRRAQAATPSATRRHRGRAMSVPRCAAPCFARVVCARVLSQIIVMTILMVPLLRLLMTLLIMVVLWAFSLLGATGARACRPE
jgi:hypothetical protein